MMDLEELEREVKKVEKLNPELHPRWFKGYCQFQLEDYQEKKRDYFRILIKDGRLRKELNIDGCKISDLVDVDNGRYVLKNFRGRLSAYIDNLSADIKTVQAVFVIAEKSLPGVADLTSKITDYYMDYIKTVKSPKTI